MVGAPLVAALLSLGAERARGRQRAVVAVATGRAAAYSAASLASTALSSTVSPPSATAAAAAAVTSQRVVAGIRLGSADGAVTTRRREAVVMAGPEAVMVGIGEAGRFGAGRDPTGIGWREVPA